MLQFALAIVSILDQAARLDSEHKCAEAEVLYQRAPVSAALLNNFGNHYLTCGAPAKAQAVFEKLLRLQPAHVNANLQLARLSVERKDGAKALGYLSQIRESDLEIALLRAEALAQAGKRTTAAGLIRDIGSSNDPRVLYALGMMCARVSFYSQAENAFSRVAAQVPDDFDLLYNLGLAAARSGRVEKARSSFESALKIKPADVDALYELGRVETAARDYNRAVYVLAQAVKAAPERADVILAAARATQMGGFYGDSLSAYDRYLTLRPTDEMVKRDRALVLGFTRTGQAEGLACLQSYVAKHPADAVGWHDLAQLSYRADRPTAIAEVSKAVQLDSKFGAAVFFRAFLFNKAGRYGESLRDANAAIGLNAKDVRALDLAGLDSLELHDAAGAEKPLREAAALSPTDPDVLFHLGRCLMEQGRREEAKPVLAEFQKYRQKWTPSPREDASILESATLSQSDLSRRVVQQYKDAVQANPNEPALRLNLARALLSAGDKDQALDEFRQLLKMEPSENLSRQAGEQLLQAQQYGLSCDFLKRASAASLLPGCL